MCGQTAGDLPNNRNHDSKIYDIKKVLVRENVADMSIFTFHLGLYSMHLEQLCNKALLQPEGQQEAVFPSKTAEMLLLYTYSM